MAKGRKTGGKNWKPGESGNPDGAKALPKEVKDSKALTSEQWFTALRCVTGITKDELIRMVNDPSTPTEVLAVASVLAKAIQHGDHKRIEFILNRTIGPVKAHMELDVPNGVALTHQAIFSLIEDLRKEEGN